MFVGWYTPYFDSSVSPWTTLGPLAVVISISLAQEGAADMKRHRSDQETNNFPCVVLRRAEDLDEGAELDKTIMDGNPVEVTMREMMRANRSARKTINLSGEAFNEVVRIVFARIRRMDIRSGDIVLIKNREMVPADIILLASSGENGVAYIETSPIDGETNLKLRNCPQLPPEAMQSVSTPRELGKNYSHPKFETIERAVKRVTRFSLLGHPDGVPATEIGKQRVDKGIQQSISTKRSFNRSPSMDGDSYTITKYSTFVTSLTSELPNASVNTFSGKITLPPINEKDSGNDIALGAENILLRGSVLRNTEWAIGVACFTGSDTKLARNSVKTPSKFSRLDLLMNRIVIGILMIMLVCVLGLALLADIDHRTKLDCMWYAGFNKSGEKWPYLPDDFDAPDWKTSAPSFISFVFTFFTLLNNFVPLSLYVTVEMITLFMMLLIGWDKNMYHADTDTPAASRSTIVTDLGLVKYVFSDKTGTLTQNVMTFKRCSVDGSIFGAPIEKANPESQDANIPENHMFHPLKRLLVGSVTLEKKEGGNDGDPGIVSKATRDKGGFLTYNAEMFLRVMAICHTVVVEKEIDASKINTKSDDSVSSTGIASVLKKWNRSRNNTEEAFPKKMEAVAEENNNMIEEASFGSMRTPLSMVKEVAEGSVSMKIEGTNRLGKNSDGSPAGFAFQAESPDEGALVSAASKEYNFQLIGRDSNGVILRTVSPSLFSVEKVTNGLKSGVLTSRQLASVTASPTIGDEKSTLKKHLSEVEGRVKPDDAKCFEETWAILAVNKFDSDRKRMSVVVRSPPSLGSIPMLLCKGADSSMLDPDVCEGGRHMMSGDGLGQSMSSIEHNDRTDGGEWESSTLLGLQSHLGLFAQGELFDIFKQYHRKALFSSSSDSFL